MVSPVIYLGVIWFSALIASAQVYIVSPAEKSILTYCQPVLISWQGGTAPYNVTVRPAGQPDGADLAVVATNTDAHEINWTLTITPSTTIWFMITESGTINNKAQYSQPLTVQPGTSMTCDVTSSSLSPSSSSMTTTPSSSSSASSSSNPNDKTNFTTPSSTDSVTGGAVPSQTNKPDGPNVAAIAGGVAGGVIAGILVTLLLMCLYLRRRRAAQRRKAIQDNDNFVIDESHDITATPYVDDRSNSSAPLMRSTPTGQPISRPISGYSGPNGALSDGSAAPTIDDNAMSTFGAAVAGSSFPTAADEKRAMHRTRSSASSMPFTAASRYHVTNPSVFTGAESTRSGSLLDREDLGPEAPAGPVEYAQDAEDVRTAAKTEVLPPLYNPRWGRSKNQVDNETLDSASVIAAPARSASGSPVDQLLALERLIATAPVAGSSTAQNPPAVGRNEASGSGGTSA